MEPSDPHQADRLTFLRVALSNCLNYLLSGAVAIGSSLLPQSVTRKSANGPTRLTGRRVKSIRFTLRGCVHLSGLAICVCLLPATVHAGGGPENLVLVVNGDSSASKLIANHYIHGRKIPARNVIYLSKIPPRELMSWVHFRDRVLHPVMLEIERRKLAASVDYIVYSADFPTVIEVAAHKKKLAEIVKEQTGREPQAQLFNANASISSLTYFAGALMKDDPGYMTLDANTYYRYPAEAILRRPFVGDQQEAFQKAIIKIKSDSDDEIAEAIETLEAMAKKNPQQLAVSYWLAKLHGQLGNAREATQWLTRSVQLGWQYQKQTRADAAFDKVKTDPLFKAIVDRIPDEAYDFVPSHGFKQRYSWGPNGMQNQEPGQGNRYFLSTVLAVTRNHGTTEKEALRQLQLSIAADESRPEGTFYFTDTADVRTKTRRPNFDDAIKALNKMGFNTEIVTTKMPVRARDIIGLTCGTASFSWIKTGSKILPGAICDNLTSYGGALHRSGQTKLSEFLANGAAGASGTVIEPYALQQKFPHPMIHVHYTRGCSLAESFYQSLQGPFQLLIVGDALCQPWATKPVLEVTGMAPGETVKGKLPIQLNASQSPVEIAAIELFVDGVPVHRVAMRDEIMFDTRGMTDGYHEIRLVAIADNPIETTGHVVLPILIDNQGQQTTLTTEHPDYLETDDIVFTARSNYGDSIELMHNGRPIAKKIGREAEFTISAELLGRGPVKLEAVAISESEKSVASLPVELRIDGPISMRKKDTETQKKKATKKEPAGKS